MATIGQLPSPAFTIQCAFTIDTLTTGMVLAGKQTGRLQWSIELDGTDSNVLRFIYEEATLGTVNVVICSSLSAVGVTANGAWHYLSIALDSALVAEIDNNQTFLSTGNTNKNHTNFPESQMVIGARDFNNTDSWQGSIDEFQIYDQFISSADRTSLYRLWNTGSEDPSFNPLTLDVAPATITETVPSGLYTSEPIVANTTGGSGNVTYLWERITTGSGGNLTINGANDTQSITVSDDRSGFTITGTVFRCTVTDLETNEVLQDECVLNITWESVQTSSGLIMHHTFDNTSGTISQDETVNNHDATFTQTIVTQTGGQVDNLIQITDVPALQFADITDTALLKPTELTFAGFVKPTATAGNSGVIFASYNSNIAQAGGHSLRLGYDSGTNSYYVLALVADGIAPVVGVNVFSTQATIDAGVWTHVAYTYDGSDLRIYINGTLQASITASITIGYLATNYVTMFNGRTDFPSTGVAGTVIPVGDYDDFRYYNTALTQTEIQDLVVTPPTFDVTLVPSGVVDVVNPPQISQYTFEAQPTGGSGNYTYSWSVISGTTFNIVSGQGTAFGTFEGFGNGETNDTIQVTVTDTTTGLIATKTGIITVNWGLV